MGKPFVFEKGNWADLRGEFFDEKGVSCPIPPAGVGFRWTSSNPKVVRVIPQKNGFLCRVEAIKIGAAKVTMSCNISGLRRQKNFAIRVVKLRPANVVFYRSFNC